jgi:hypothetical protein
VLQTLDISYDHPVFQMDDKTTTNLDDKFPIDAAELVTVGYSGAGIKCALWRLSESQKLVTKDPKTGELYYDMSRNAPPNTALMLNISGFPPDFSPKLQLLVTPLMPGEDASLWKTGGEFSHSNVALDTQTTSVLVRRNKSLKIPIENKQTHPRARAHTHKHRHRKKAHGSMGFLSGIQCLDQTSR